MSSNKQLSNEQHTVSSVQVSNEQSTDKQQNFIFGSLLPLIRDENSEHAELLDQLEVDMKLRMCHHQQRLAHSFSVGRLAQTMAQTYGVDVFHAGVAGILHDWAKVLSHEEQLALADSLKLDFGVPHQLVVPLLHGPIAARLLPKVYPWLSADTVQAIDRHTVGAHDMSDLDKIVFSADALVDEIEKKVRINCAEKPAAIEGRTEGSWILMDYGAVLVHIFLPEQREYYRLEKLWGDAPQLSFA